jgi:NTP pyrophosphatase (non-canonical NTP hydrolase)
MIEHPNEYQKQTGLTAVYPKDHALEYLTLGLAGESGEVANKVKKIIRGDYSSELTPEVKEQVILELGDVLWYAAQIASLLDTRLSTVMEKNLLKLQQRQTAGTLKGDSRGAE